MSPHKSYINRLVDMSKIISPEKDNQNSTHAMGHLGLVEVKYPSRRISHGKPTKICKSTTSWCSSSGKNSTP
jgi:hypothetical protein